jgi:peptidoglycan hydrolase CwlO-like protein
MINNTSIIIEVLNGALGKLETIINSEDVSEDAKTLAQGMGGYIITSIDIIGKQSSEISDLKDFVQNLQNDIQNLIGQIEGKET